MPAETRAKLIKWCALALGTWILVGMVLGFLTVPPGPRYLTRSPDGEMESYLYRPWHRRAIRGMCYPVEWPVNLAAMLVAGSPVGSFYTADYSFYVRRLASGERHRTSGQWTGPWSPDSRRIACAGLKKKGLTSFLLIDAAGQIEHAIPVPGAPREWAITDIAWAADSKTVFFRVEYKVFAVAVADKQAVAIADGLNDDAVDVLKIGSEWRAKSGTNTPVR